MAHIGFFNIPGFGHVNTTTGLVAELVARGHRVSYAVPESHGAEVRRAGAELIPYETGMTDPGSTMTATADPDRFTTVDFVHNLRGVLRETRSVVPVVEAAFTRDTPDLVLYDGVLGWSGRIAADRLGIPAVRCLPTMAANEHWSLAAGGYAVFDVDDPELTAVFRDIGELFTALGVEHLGEEFFGNAGPGAATLVFVPRAFQPAAGTFADTVHFVGPCAAERAFDGRWTPPADGRLLVLVSLGTLQNDQPGFFRDCVDAFRDAPWNVVLAVGHRIDRAALGPVPPHVEVVPHVPLQQVLRHADAFVTHAGMGSLMEALTAGVPVVAVPQMGEQRANADRLLELGLGSLLRRPEVTAATLRTAVADLLADPAVRERARAMRRGIQEADGPRTAADLVEAQLRPEQPAVR
ncbi:macrolide family glycosyltransferase [Streptomyces sp. NPDC090021]|uniref:macrolide family glycosyltransferase n=1 Tax=Streptomyces sp. NPDC090021 TaxID=3365919 RepID=UPI0037F8E5C7